MEGSSRDRELYSQLFDLIPNEREWLARRDEARFGVSEDKKLELRLGPPGEDWVDKENREKDGRERDESSLLSLGCFSSSASKSNNNHNNSISAGAKRGFSDTVEAKAGEQTWLLTTNANQHQKLSFSEKPGATILSSPWCSSTSPSPSPFHVKTHQQQQQSKPQFLQFPSIPHKLSVMSKEPPQTCNDTKLAELQNPEKKACSPAYGSVPANTSVLNNSHKRTSPAPVVGWPPVRSFRKNLASGSSSKPASEIRDAPPAEVNGEKTESCKKGLFVKINMDGVPIGRKVDLKAYDSYEKLSSAVDELFRGLLAAQSQGDLSAAGDQNNDADHKPITGLLDGKGEYTLVYEDNEGDRMLVGDVPWHMFVSTVKRLRVLKSSELPHYSLVAVSPKRVLGWTVE